MWLSGVPQEMSAMLRESVLPWIVEQNGESTIHEATFKIHGITESRLDDLMTPLNLGNDAKLAFRAHFPDLTLRLTVSGGAPQAGQFTKAEGQINQGQPNNSVGRFTFTTKRSATTSDGAFMVDRTVKVELVRTSVNTVVATHTYGSGDIKDYVQIDTAVPEYKTNFRRGDLLGPPGAATAYKARVSFLDVHGTFRQQAESAPVTF